MAVPLQLIVFSIPSLFYVAVHRLCGKRWSEAFGKIGWKTCRLKNFLWGLGVAILLGGLAWLAFRFIPPNALQSPNINISYYAGWKLSVASFLLAWLREAILALLLVIRCRH
jgi:hypothetical protein